MNRNVNFDQLIGIVRERGADRRSITAIAGPPGAGKSTLADQLADTLNASEPGNAAVFPMDGYHFDDLVLNAHGWRSRKGAPHTFDTAGFAHMLARLRRNAEPEVAVPIFDRELEISRNSARVISAQVRHLIVEGNYLFLDEAPWSDLAELFDTTVYLDVPLPVLGQRLEARWKHLDASDRAEKLERNDLPNAKRVRDGSRPAEFVLRDLTAQPGDQ